MGIRADDYPLYPGLPDFQDTFYLSHYSNEVTTCSIHANATVSNFVKSELNGHFDCNLLVLTGDLYNVWATACEYYVNKTWPQRATAILRLFELIGEMKPGTEILNSLMDFGPTSREALEVSAKLIDKVVPLDPESVLTVHLTACPSDLALYVEAMAWLHTVLQPQAGFTPGEGHESSPGDTGSSGSLRKPSLQTFSRSRETRDQYQGRCEQI